MDPIKSKVAHIPLRELERKDTDCKTIDVYSPPADLSALIGAYWDTQDNEERAKILQKMETCTGPWTHKSYKLIEV